VDDIEIICCADADEWDRWLAEHGETRPAVWLTIAKKGSGAVSMTAAGAGGAGQGAAAGGGDAGGRERQVTTGPSVVDRPPPTGL